MILVNFIHCQITYHHILFYRLITVLCKINYYIKMSNQFSFINIKSLYNDKYINFNIEAIKDLLNTLSSEEIFSIAHTATSQKIIPESIEEAIDVVLLYTPDVERLFSYRRITSHILMNYLFHHGIKVNAQTTRTHLISNVLKIWVEKFPKENKENQSTFSKEKNLSIHAQESTSYSEETFNNIRQPAVNKTIGHSLKIKSNVFAADFVEWFYSNLNSINKNNLSYPQCKIDESVFCTNSSLDIFLVSPNNENKINCVGSFDCSRGLYETVKEHHLLFSPNIDTGIQAEKSAHGLIKIFSCGTLHKENSFLGIFEQEFGIVRNPSCKSWQIFYTKVNLKEAIAELPALPSFPLFEIDVI